MYFSLKLLQLLLITAALASGERGGFKCNFGGLTPNKSLSIEQILPASVGQSHVCEASTSNQQSILLIKANITEAKKVGALHVFVLTTDGALQGHLDVFNSVGESQEFLQLCPAHPAPHNKSQKHHILFSGTPSLPYMAEIAYTNQMIDLDDKKSITLTSERESEFFIFEAPENVESAQLAVTVTSESDVSAYLTVSPRCSDVVQQKIDRVLGDRTQTMRLSFSRKGRLTLSRASSPKLKGGKAWYIGVALKNASYKDTPKEVTLSLKRDFNYGYAVPICFIVFVPLVGGVIVAVLALYCFRESFEHRGKNRKVSKTVYNILRLYYKDYNKDSATLPDVSLSEVTRDMFDPKFLLCWFCHGPKTFSYTTCIVGCVLFVGSFQFVYANWYAMVDTGDRDKCYYNDFCYRVSDNDIPYNLMISNVAYIIHGVILAISVWKMEAEVWVWSKKLAKATRPQRVPSDSHQEIPEHLLECYNITAHMPSLTVPESPKDAEVIYTIAHKRQVSYSVGYAFAWALFFEGVFSSTYHLCPTRMTFQFDTAFMFVIAGLIVLSLFNGFSVRKCEETKPVDATFLFLFVIVPLYIFNYLGSIYSLPYYSMSTTAKTMFFIFLGIWYLVICFWVGYKLFYERKTKVRKRNKIIKGFFFIISIIVSTILVLVMALLKKDLSGLFLYGCILASISGILGKVFVTLCPSNWSTTRGDLKLKMRCNITKGCYMVVTFVVLACAVYIFKVHPTTDKSDTPEESRNLNQECYLFGFYDHHDLWHLLSSFALLMGAFVVMFVSECSQVSSSQPNSEQSRGEENTIRSSTARFSQDIQIHTL